MLKLKVTYVVYRTPFYQHLTSSADMYMYYPRVPPFALPCFDKYTCMHMPLTCLCMYMYMYYHVHVHVYMYIHCIYMYFTCTFAWENVRCITFSNFPLSTSGVALYYPVYTCKLCRTETHRIQHDCTRTCSYVYIYMYMYMSTV